MTTTNPYDGLSMNYQILKFLKIWCIVRICSLPSKARTREAISKS
jgi:hypothetical protein